MKKEREIPSFCHPERSLSKRDGIKRGGGEKKLVADGKKEKKVAKKPGKGVKDQVHGNPISLSLFPPDQQSL